MIRIATIIGVGILGAALLVGWGTLGHAGEQKRTALHQYTGQIASIKIDRCGLQPGTCEGSLMLRQQNGQEVVLAIQPGTWIKRGNELVLIDELGVGNYITVQAMSIPGASPTPGTVGSSPGERAVTIEESARP